MARAYLRSNFPKAELPAEEDICEVVVASIDEEEIPSLETLLEHRHLTEAASCAAAGKEQRRWCFCLNEDGGRHGDARAVLACNMTEEPILAHAETRVLFECLNQELSVPENNCAVRKGSASDLARE